MRVSSFPIATMASLLATNMPTKTDAFFAFKPSKIPTGDQFLSMHLRSPNLQPLPGMKPGNHPLYIDKAMQCALSPLDVKQRLEEGNQRFISREPLERDYLQQIELTADQQCPMAAILSCIDSRAVVERVFDLGFGDVFTARVAGNVVDSSVIGSLEFACNNAGAKLIVVMGHTRCGAVKAAVNGVEGSSHLKYVLDKIRASAKFSDTSEESLDRVAEENVHRTIREITYSSEALASLVKEEVIKIVGAMYDVKTGVVRFL